MSHIVHLLLIHVNFCTCLIRTLKSGRPHGNGIWDRQKHNIFKKKKINIGVNNAGPMKHSLTQFFLKVLFLWIFKDALFRSSKRKIRLTEIVNNFGQILNLFQLFVDKLIAFYGITSAQRTDKLISV